MLNIFPQPMCSGDVYPLKMSFTQGGQPFNLTGKTFGLTVKLNPEDSNDTTEAIQWQNLNGDTTGVIAFSVGPFEAGTYWMDVKTWTTGSTGSRSTVIPPLQLRIIQSVTTRDQ
jgi:hypothetical protein